jgi:glycosyltransferase involved in cell wall biosynthesis
MTRSAELLTSGAREGDPLGSRWRAEAEERQMAVVPSGRVVVSCSAPFGTGGLGRHLKEVADALERGGRAPVCICGSTRASALRSADRSPRHRLRIPYLNELLSHEPLSRMPIPLSPGVRTRAFMIEFDAYAAQRLPDADHLIAFNGQAMTQFRAARRAGYASIALVSANSHLRRVARQHALAQQQYPLEGSWAARLIDRNVKEYAQADCIYVGSRYTRESFLEEGFSDDALSPFPFTPDPRYKPDPPPTTVGTFDIIYIGSLAVHKGVPLLIDAVRRLPHADIRLLLVGGWGTRGMRLFIQGACSEDRRIKVCPGDPLPHLHSARLCVHPAYEDGFAYAPAEALACGVPVIVSEDTGMKDLVASPRTGLVLPTGDLDALVGAIEAAYRGEILAR